MIEPNFERLKKALFLEGEPDYVPKIELWIDNSIMSKFLGKEVKDMCYDSKGIIEFMSKAGYDYAHVIPIYNFKKGKNPLQMDSGLISKIEDFERYEWPKKEDVNFDPVLEAEKYLPDGMKLISGSRGGIFEETWMIMGFGNFTYSLIDNPELVKKVIGKIAEIIIYIFENVAKMDHVGALWLSDDIAYKTGTMISPKHLREFLFPYYKKIGDIAKKHGKPFLYHSDGKLYSVLDDLIECGINALHPIEPISMDIYKLKKEYGRKLCLLGNVAVENELTRGKKEDVENSVKEKIEKLAPGGGYCCGSSNTIPSYIPFENYLAMINAIEKYGKYPIR